MLAGLKKALVHYKKELLGLCLKAGRLKELSILLPRKQMIPSIAENHLGHVYQETLYFCFANPFSTWQKILRIRISPAQQSKVE